MPNRIAKDSSRKCPQLDTLTDGAERLYWRLLLTADDFGRFEADPRIVKADCFPLKVDTLKTVTIDKQLQEIEGAGLIIFYRVTEREYGQFCSFDPPRAKVSKFPEPSTTEVTATENKGDSICTQMQADAPVVRSSEFVFEDRSSKIEIPLPPSQKKSSGSTAKEWESEDLYVKEFLETQRSVNLPADGLQRLLDPAFWERTGTVCGGINLEFLQVEFAKMGNWLASNASRAPTPRGWPKFVSGWLERAYERDRRNGNTQKAFGR